MAITEGTKGITPHLPAHSLVILRGYMLPERERIAFSLAKLCRKNKWKLLIAGNPRLALKIGAAGIHMPEKQAFRLASWRRKKPHWLITMAAHQQSSLVKAARYGVDAVLYSPLFPTNSHPGKPALGIGRFNQTTRKSHVPIYALGGITEGNKQRLNGAKIVGIAGIGLFAGEDC